MRRVSLVLVVVVFGPLVAWGFSTGAQEATPAPFATPGPGEFAVAPGQIGRDLAAGQLDALPQTPAFIAISRITSAPGSVFTGVPDNPSAALILVESGHGTWRLQAPVTITRTTGPEPVAAGAAFTLGPGESFVWPPLVAGEFRIEGPEPAVTLVAYLAPVGDEGATPLPGTPAP
jgi:hypothetical protein